MNRHDLKFDSYLGRGSDVAYYGIAALISMIVLVFMTGCTSQPPGGSPMHPPVLGTSTDEINRLQEDNAELAKLIIYAHEFEINLQQDLENRENDKSKGTFDYLPKIRPHGIRLTPAGEAHVRRIADFLRSHQLLGAQYYAVVEQSSTSKRWETNHHYPVHQNEQLDELRRLVVVSVLESLGVDNANQLVVIAPAFPTGLSAIEASDAYQNTRNSGQDFRY